MLLEQAIEMLRQERETFDQHKRHESRWFSLRLIMGYSSIILLGSVIVIASYIVLGSADFPTSVVAAPSQAAVSQRSVRC